MVLAGPLAVLVTRLTGRDRPIFIMGHFGTRALRGLLGVRVREEGHEHVPGGQPAVYCINHRSFIDGMFMDVLHRRCPRLKVLFKAEMMRWPILGPAMHAGGFVPVERAVPEQAHAAVDRAVARLAEGDSFLLAPEGTRSDTETMRPFKKGAFVMAIRAQVPVVPVAIVGSGTLMPRGQWFVMPGEIIVRYGTPVPTRGLTLADRSALAVRVRDDIQQLLETRGQRLEARG
jgi:1-acyl-sn-glycerol-3-phosphate acyltransferase